MKQLRKAAKSINELDWGSDYPRNYPRNYTSKNMKHANKREPSLINEIVTGSAQGILFGLALAVIMIVIGKIGSAIGL